MADCWRSVPRIDKTIIQQNVLFVTSETYFFSTLLVDSSLRFSTSTTWYLETVPSYSYYFARVQKDLPPPDKRAIVLEEARRFAGHIRQYVRYLP
jgi:hypothetical protein